MKNTRLLTVLLLAALALVVLGEAYYATGPTRAQQAFEKSPLVAVTPLGKFDFNVEIAATDAQRTTGLMYRQSMARDAGMLFDFKISRPVMMWMKNTYLPLDMVFIDKSGRIVRIAKDTTPHSLDVISSGGPVRYVLELNAGTSERVGLQAGQVLQHRLFGNLQP